MDTPIPSAKQAGLPSAGLLSPAQAGAPNPDQRRRRAAFYLRNGFRETGVGRTSGPVAMTILLKGDDTAPRD